MLFQTAGRSRTGNGILARNCGVRTLGDPLPSQVYVQRWDPPASPFFSKFDLQWFSIDVFVCVHSSHLPLPATHALRCKSCIALFIKARQHIMCVYAFSTNAEKWRSTQGTGYQLL
uniref:Uncharacterized protein n=1 Tax=Toxoplasma gondii (strain ATCC 50861 / VEG) TaxID=432359 RepID=A0A0F7UTG1_TOXGV|nr:TPA: hypothetical protein BN1205_090445 [Toxoplasma gondii VEG]